MYTYKMNKKSIKITSHIRKPTLVKKKSSRNLLSEHELITVSLVYGTKVRLQVTTQRVKFLNNKYGHETPCIWRYYRILHVG